jgi:hypothetical protein
MILFFDVYGQTSEVLEEGRKFIHCVLDFVAEDEVSNGKNCRGVEVRGTAPSLPFILSPGFFQSGSLDSLKFGVQSVGSWPKVSDLAGPRHRVLRSVGGMSSLTARIPIQSFANHAAWIASK